MKRVVVVIIGVLAIGGMVSWWAQSSEIVNVKYRGPADLASFSCESVARSNVIQRICFSPTKAEMIISLNGTYYAYCGIPAATVDALKAANSAGRFYNAQVKGRYGCR